MIYQEFLNKHTYRKVIVRTDGTIEPTTAPMGTVLGRYRLWELVDAAGHKLYIGYDPEADQPNHWWNLFRYTEKIPRVKGDFILARFLDGLNWDSIFALNQLSGYMHSKYVAKKHTHKFSFDM